MVNKGKGGGRFKKRDGDVKMGVAKGSASSKDFRWKKGKQDKMSQETIKSNGQTGDTLNGSDEMVIEGVNQALKGLAAHKGAAAQKKAKRAVKLRRRKERFDTNKSKRREMHERLRVQTDDMVRRLPHQYLWERYVSWAGDKLTTMEKAAEKWSPEQVFVVEDGSNNSLIPFIKSIIGQDYRTKTGWKSGTDETASISCISLGHGAVKAVEFATRMFDGLPVGKLFSKHIKIEAQRSWLENSKKQPGLTNATGTPKRVQRLIEEDTLSLKHTVGVVIDMSRDNRLMNLIDITSSCGELFEFIHEHLRAEMATGRLKVILVIPKVEEMPTERRMGSNEKTEEDAMEE